MTVARPPMPGVDGQTGRTPMRLALTRALAILAALVVSVTLLVMFVAGAVLLRSYAHDNLSQVAWQSAYAAEVAVVFNDRSAAADAVRNAAGLPGVTAVTVRDASGDVVARVLREGLTEADTAPGWLDPGPVNHAIVNGGTTIGSVEVHGETTGIGALILASLLGALAAGALAWLTTVIVGRSLERTIIDPMRKIAAATHGVQAERDRRLRAPRARIAEVDELSQDFNRLLDELDGWQEQVQVAHKQLLDRANHDPLSGLPNRAHFLDRVEQMLHFAQRSGQRFALLYMDGDNFKATNDRHGHAAGDEVIRQMGSRLAALQQGGAVTARMGGDEFAMLLPDISDVRAPALMAEAISAAMREPIVLADGTPITANFSVGIANYPEDGVSTDALIAHADAAMYAGKAARRDALAEPKRGAVP